MQHLDQVVVLLAAAQDQPDVQRGVLDVVGHDDGGVEQVGRGAVLDVQQHDGSSLRLRKLHPEYDPTDRYAALSYMNAHQARGEVLTGLLYVDQHTQDLHAALNTVHEPLNKLREAQLCPGSELLASINASLR